MQTKEKSSVFAGLKPTPVIEVAESEEKSVDLLWMTLTPCPKCMDFEPYRYEDGKMICDRCGADMGDIYMTRAFHKTPIGAIVVRDERDEP